MHQFPLRGVQMDRSNEQPSTTFSPHDAVFHAVGLPICQAAIFTPQSAHHACELCLLPVAEVVLINVNP